VTIEPTAPLRLAYAAKIAFPDGSMSASGLRREVRRGRLEIEVIAGRQYATHTAIEGMGEQCRVEPKVHGSTSSSGRGAKPSGSSAIPMEARSALDAELLIVNGLKRDLKPNLGKKHKPNFERRDPGAVVIADVLSRCAVRTAPHDRSSRNRSLSNTKP
jgi:hypothetical protein